MAEDSEGLKPFSLYTRLDLPGAGEACPIYAPKGKRPLQRVAVSV